MNAQVFFFFLTLSQTSVGFLGVCSTSLLKILLEKEKLHIMSNFSISHSVFYPFLRVFCYLHLIWNCPLRSLWVWKSLTFVVWDRVNGLSQGIFLIHSLLTSITSILEVRPAKRLNWISFLHASFEENKFLIPLYPINSISTMMHWLHPYSFTL